MGTRCMQSGSEISGFSKKIQNGGQRFTRDRLECLSGTSSSDPNMFSFTCFSHTNTFSSSWSKHQNFFFFFSEQLMSNFRYKKATF